MKKLAVFFCFFFSISMVTFGQNEILLGLNGSAIIPQSGEAGVGSKISLIYNLNEQISIHHGVGILGWGSGSNSDFSKKLFIYSLSARYYFVNNNVRPYLSAELNYAIGKYRFTNGYVDRTTNELIQYQDEYKISEFLSGLGLGLTYPLSELFILDLNYTLILTVKTDALYHSRGTFGILLRI